MATNRSSNRSSGAFDKMKFEVANELVLPLTRTITET